jgi:transposase
VQQADRDEGSGDGGLTTEELQELQRLRREIKQLRVERDILSKAATWFAREADSKPSRSSNS